MTSKEQDIVLRHAEGAVTLNQAVWLLLDLWDMRWMGNDARVVRAVEDWIDATIDDLIERAFGT